MDVAYWHQDWLAGPQVECPFCHKKRPICYSEYSSRYKSCNAGLGSSRYNLSDSNRQGWNELPHNIYKSVSWAVKAASFGSADAYGRLSQACSNGVILQTCPLMHHTYLEISAKKGSMKSRRTLIGLCHYEADFLGEIRHKGQRGQVRVWDRDEEFICEVCWMNV